MDDVVLKKEFSTDGTWFKYRDPRALEERNPSRTIQDRWYYGPDDRLEIRFETTPERGWGIWFEDRKVGFSEDTPDPEGALGAPIQRAKRRAVELREHEMREIAPGQ